jgi:hypothetical protein
MLRIALTTALTALLSLAPLSAQTLPDCTNGRARGAWDLPVKEEPGRVRGILGDGTGRRMVLEARLVPAALENGQRGGLLAGVLTPITPDGLAMEPIAEVHGRWTVEPGRNGRFEAGIFALGDGPIDLRNPMGKMAGVFSDPMVDGNDEVGRFAARWVICR